MGLRGKTQTRISSSDGSTCSTRPWIVALLIHRHIWKAYPHLVGSPTGRKVVDDGFHLAHPWCWFGDTIALQSTSSTTSASIQRTPCTTFGVRVHHHQHHQHLPPGWPEFGPSFHSCPIGLDRPSSRFHRTFEREDRPIEPKRFPFQATSRPEDRTTTKTDEGRRIGDDASDAMHAHDDEANVRPPCLAWWKEA